MNTKPRAFALLTFLALLAVGLPAVAQDTYGPVRPGESLWGIAGKVYPNHPLTRDQAMLALLKANPEAFGVFCNANSALKIGSLLQVPPLKEATALSPAEAQREFQRQVREWNAHKHTAKPLTCPPVTKAAATPAATAAPAQQPPAATAAPSKPTQAKPPPQATPTPPKPSATGPVPTTPSKPSAAAPAPTTPTQAVPTPSATAPGPATPSQTAPTPPKPSAAASAPTAPAQSPPTHPTLPAKAPARGAPAQTAAPPTSELAKHEPMDGLAVVALLLGGLLLVVDWHD
jgi:FimV-like protein